jgi:hypothetical protein
MRVHQSNDTVIRIVMNDGVLSVDHFVSGVGPTPGLPG